MIALIRNWKIEIRNLIFLFFNFLPIFSGFNLYSQSLHDEAPKASEYLNRVRANPKFFSEEIGVNLSNVKPLSALKWNDTLAKVAEQKALDMANRHYFGHTTPEGKGINIMLHEAGYKLPQDWIKNKSDNFFESINAGTETATGAIKDLIVDSYDSEKGHRKHLLGMNDFYSTLTDIGIGHVKVENSQYKYYTVVIIAKQNW